jgi:hypothetical protein
VYKGLCAVKQRGVGSTARGARHVRSGLSGRLEYSSRGGEQGERGKGDVRGVVELRLGEKCARVGCAFYGIFFACVRPEARGRAGRPLGGRGEGASREASCCALRAARLGGAHAGDRSLARLARQPSCSY